MPNKIKNKARFVLFLALLAIKIVITVCFPAREVHYYIYIYEFGWPDTFLTVRDLRQITWSGWFPIQFSFDPFPLAFNVLFVWLVACGIYKLYTIVRRWLSQSQAT